MLVKIKKVEQDEIHTRVHETAAKGNIVQLENDAGFIINIEVSKDVFVISSHEDIINIVPIRANKIHIEQHK